MQKNSQINFKSIFQHLQTQQNVVKYRNQFIIITMRKLLGNQQNISQMRKYGMTLFLLIFLE